MAVLLQIKNIHKSYGHQVLLDGAEATLTDDVKVGFVGRNGAGKSTLLRIILGDEDCEKGEIVRHPKARLGYLRQHDPFQPGETAIQFLMRDSGQPDWKCGEVAGQFELKDAYLEGPLSKLSGGWQTRVKLAALLLHEPNLLLLDEPTNFLDLRTQILLEHFLRDYKEACLIVSHDRAFSRHHLQPHARPDARQADDVSRQDRRLSRISARAPHARGADQRSGARQTPAPRRVYCQEQSPASTATRARSKSKQLERLEVVEIEGDEPTANIRAPIVEPRKGPALRCKDLAIGYPEREIAAGISVEVEHGSRAAIVGDNGQGKTTFLRTVVDSLEPLAGEARWGYGCQLGIYAQHVYTSLPENQTVLEYLEYNAAPGTKTQQILDLAGALLFRGEQVKKRIPVLSGGERARLCLAGLLLGNFNVLILDEPGNHLDVDTVEALAEALLAYKGTVIFTSHDRHFMKRVASCIIEVRDSHVTTYRGDYDSYLYSVNKEIDDGERELAKGHSKAPPKIGKAPAAPPRRACRSEREIRKEVANIERTIARLDDQKRQSNEQLMKSTDPAEALRLHNEVTALTTQLADAEERWCRLQEELGETE